VILEEFLTSDARRGVSRAAEVDALRDRDALQDAALLDIRVSGVWSCAWLLLDCKGALNVRDGNTAVLVVHGLDEFTWVSENDPPGRLNRAVESWTPTVKDPGWRLSAMLWRTATLTVVARSGEFYVGDVPGGDDPPPDFGVDDDATVRAGLASWASEFSPYYCSFLE
jgi:hypothetical protein